MCHPSSFGSIAGETLRRKGGMRKPGIWWIQELDSRSIRFLLSGIGRMPPRELYFDEPEFSGKQNRRWRGKGVVFGEDDLNKGRRGRRISLKGSRYSHLKVKSMKSWNLMQAMKGGSSLISNAARLSFTSKIFSESLVIEVSNSNSKEEQIKILHHASCTIDEPPVTDLLWFDRVLLPETLSWSFVFLQSLASMSGLGRSPGTELHSDGPEFGGKPHWL